MWLLHYQIKQFSILWKIDIVKATKFGPNRFKLAIMTYCQLSYRNQNSESQLYNAMINPLLRNTIKGAIWYQGKQIKKNQQHPLVTYMYI